MKNLIALVVLLSAVDSMAAGWGYSERIYNAVGDQLKANPTWGVTDANRAVEVTQAELLKEYCDSHLYEVVEDGTFYCGTAKEREAARVQLSKRTMECYKKYIVRYEYGLLFPEQYAQCMLSAYKAHGAVYDTKEQ